MASEAPASFDELRERLQKLLPELAEGQRRIARLVLDDPEGTAFRSIGESAELAGVHRSSLVRFAGMLGLPGYPALVRLCRAQLAEDAQLVRRLDQAREHADADEFFAAVVEHDTRNLTRSLARIDQRDWRRAVDALAHAATVHVIGLRKCFSIAYLAAYLLHMARTRVRQIGTTAGLLVDELRDVGPDDALLAVSIRRYTRDTLRAVELARRAGVTTIALTDDPSSPLAAASDVTFYVETGSVTILRSLTAFTALVQALATAVAVRLGARSREELAVDERLLDEFGMYAESE
jgi:DNA-binding MurR/RpiR family transcriptional regulator